MKENTLQIHTYFPFLNTRQERQKIPSQTAYHMRKMLLKTTWMMMIIIMLKAKKDILFSYLEHEQ